MPRPSRSTLMMPMSAQSSLSHCTTTRPGMLAFSSGTTDDKSPWHTTMPPECWPRWRGRSCICRHSSAKCRTRGASPAMPTSASRFGQRVVGIDELELVHHPGQPIDLPFVEVERLADLARRALAAIGDDVGRHGGAVLAVLLVDVLDHALAAVAARQVEIDVGPLAALFRQEPLEQQLHADRIDGGDAEAVAHGAVGGRAAALHQDVLLPAEIDDVPDDQEVAGQLELLDQVELARHLQRAPCRNTAGSDRARRLPRSCAGTSSRSRRRAPGTSESDSRGRAC